MVAAINIAAMKKAAESCKKMALLPGELVSPALLPVRAFMISPEFHMDIHKTLTQAIESKVTRYSFIKFVYFVILIAASADGKANAIAKININRSTGSGLK